MEDGGRAEVFARHRDRLVSVAYRITGSMADAEDAAQEAWLRWSKANVTEVRDPLAFLVRITTRLALDRLRRIRARRETYQGEWLPEPTVASASMEEDLLRAEAISMGMLRVLETLSPLERAVFVLREAFDLPYAEIGEIVDRKEPTVRQTSRRARAHVVAQRRRFEIDPGSQVEVTNRFFAAVQTGDLDGLMAVLAPDVTLITDSGGKVRAPLLPLKGPDRIARFLVSVAARDLPGLETRIIELNGGPGIVAISGDEPQAAVLFDVLDGRISTIYLVANPEKLGAIRPMSREWDGAASSG